MYCNEDVPPKHRIISDRDYAVLIHVIHNLAYAGKDFGGISRTAIGKIFWKHMKRIGLYYRELDYYGQVELCAKDISPPKPLEFVADNRESIKKAIKEFYY